MKILIIGGTRFVGRAITEHLVKAGHKIILINRGRHLPGNNFPDVEIINGNIHSPLFAKKMKRLLPLDAIIHTIAYGIEDVEYLKPVLIHHKIPLIFISTGQTYLVTVNKAIPCTELAYYSPIRPAPQDESDYKQWLYGMKKRDVEDTLQKWYEQYGIPSISLRCPVLHGFHDYSLRLFSYIARILDGGPLVLPPDDFTPISHMWVDDIARAIELLLNKMPTAREVYNLSGGFNVPLPDFIHLVASNLNANPEVLFLKKNCMSKFGKLIAAASPFSGKWVSVLDSQKFQKRFGWKPTDLNLWLPEVVRYQAGHFDTAALQNYAKRKQEVAVAENKECMHREKSDE